MIYNTICTNEGEPSEKFEEFRKENTQGTVISLPQYNLNIEMCNRTVMVKIQWLTNQHKRRLHSHPNKEVMDLLIMYGTLLKAYQKQKLM